MKSWHQALKDAWWSGGAASVLSTLAMAALGRLEIGSGVAPTNAISHWIFAESAVHRNEPSVRHTVVGYAIHHSASIFWAVLYERWFGARAERDGLPAALAGGTAVAAVALVVDCEFTPRRLRPGFERRLSGEALLGVYAAIALGLALASYTRGRTSRPAQVTLPWRAHVRRVGVGPRFSRRLAAP